MKFDKKAAEVKRNSMCEAALAARINAVPLSEESINEVLNAFSRVTPPAEPELRLELITIMSLHREPKAESRKPGNVVLNWRKLIDIIPDISLAGLGATGLPISAPWSAVLVGLYIWNKIWRGSVEEFTDAEAITILALWKNRDSRNKISETDGFIKTNELRTNYSLHPLTLGQFTTIMDRLVKIDCVEINGGVVWLREWIRVKY